MLTAVLGSYAISFTAKILLHRSRPSLWELSYPLPLDYAFPSGHAMLSMTLVVALIVLSWGTRWSTFVTIFGTIFAIAIGWTRMYLGVHFPSDVIGGWMLAIAWVMTVSLLLVITYIKTTNWVLEGAIATFPLMYHYRIIPFSGQRADVDRDVIKDDVVLAARHSETLNAVANEIKNIGRQALAIPTYISDIEQVKALVESAISTYGHIASFLAVSAVISPFVLWLGTGAIALRYSIDLSREAKV